MLCLQLLPGEYITIGDNVVVQYDNTTGSRCRLAVYAPREIPVVRGTVLERGGQARPDFLVEKKRWYKREFPWDQSKARALAAMRRLLSEMDSRDPNVRSLRRELDHIFPAVTEGGPDVGEVIVKAE